MGMGQINMFHGQLWLSCYGLLTGLVLLNSVDRWRNTTQFLQKWCNFVCLCAWASEGFYPGGALVDFSNSFSKGAPKVVKFIFYLSKLRKQHFLLKFSNSCHNSNTHACV